MTTQIAVRLPDEAVAFLDRSVAQGLAPSRAALIASALEREMRLTAARRDAQILSDVGAQDDLDDLVAWTAAHTSLDE
ncbi:hypothetical protein [Piscicoccus intestinalis]|uniref:hypothetical protein n=1 Tax=Piscicoccus intestinalis TaxID=746033 RepID=UPI00083932E6|nr:hypothetical protein [Piscicoccus intestinalis]